MSIKWLFYISFTLFGIYAPLAVGAGAIANNPLYNSPSNTKSNSTQPNSSTKLNSATVKFQAPKKVYKIISTVKVTFFTGATQFPENVSCPESSVSRTPLRVIYPSESVYYDEGFNRRTILPGYTCMMIVSHWNNQTPEDALTKPPFNLTTNTASPCPPAFNVSSGVTCRIGEGTGTNTPPPNTKLCVDATAMRGGVDGFAWTSGGGRPKAKLDGNGFATIYLPGSNKSLGVKDCDLGQPLLLYLSKNLILNISYQAQLDVELEHGDYIDANHCNCVTCADSYYAPGRTSESYTQRGISKSYEIEKGTNNMVRLNKIVVTPTGDMSWMIFDSAAGPAYSHEPMCSVNVERSLESN